MTATTAIAMATAITLMTIHISTSVRLVDTDT
jgi:hypothetical protein